MHQAMLLTVQACISSPYLFYKLTCYITALVLALDIISSSTALSWSHGTKFADSFLKFTTFSNLSYYLSSDDQGFFCFSKDILLAILQQLVDVDYCKSLIVDRMSLELRDSSNVFFSAFGQCLQKHYHTPYLSVLTLIY